MASLNGKSIHNNGTPNQPYSHPPIEGIAIGIISTMVPRFYFGKHLQVTWHSQLPIQNQELGQRGGKGFLAFINTR